MKNPTWPNNLHDRPLFSVHVGAKNPPKTRSPRSSPARLHSSAQGDYNSNHHFPPTTNHPGVYIPTFPYAPPGLSTEFIWECEYDKLPRSFFQQLFPVDTHRKEYYTPRRDTMIQDGPASVHGIHHGKRHYYPPREVDHMNNLLYDRGGGGWTTETGQEYSPSHTPSSASPIYNNSDQSLAESSFTSSSSSASHSRSPHEVEMHVNRLKELWTDAKHGKGSVSDLKREVNGFADDNGIAHRERIAQIGYGRVMKGSMAEPIQYNHRFREESDPGWKEHLHHLRVADIGYGRVMKGGLMEPIS
ncbi:hypothetical protein BDR26DRAFT_869518 [Obelidium mucronatum]|nr:hypothetical protein BDR26DRAFT_869518 [Obelidium mucronatum]